MSESSAPAPDRAVEAGRGALFIGFAKAFFMVSAFLQKVLLDRFVGSAAFGAFSVVNAAVSLVNNATVQGTIQSVSKFTAEDDAQADAVKRAGLRLQLIVGSVMGLGFFLAAPVIARAYHHPEFTRWFRMVALIPFVYSLYSVFVGSANGLRRFRVQAGFDVGFSTAKTILLLGGAVIFGLAGAFAGFVAAALIILVVSAAVMALPRRDSGSFPMKRLVTYMVGIVVYTLLINAALNGDILLLRRFAPMAGASPELANSLTANYESIRNFALLPYQALLVITFVIFPLVSRSTFEQDREATAAYIRQTLRYALILAGLMASVLAGRADGLMRTFYRPEYAAGATALQILVAGIVCLALLGVTGSIINASGRTRVAATLMAVTVLVGAGCAFAVVPAQLPGPAMLNAAAAATALGMASGLAAALLYLRREFKAGPPLPSVLRVATSAGVALLFARFFPGQGKIVTLLVLALTAVVFLGVLIALREFGPQDRAKLGKILGRRR
jgi:O-antigen/teichoic acid export membrane protein